MAGVVAFLRFLALGAAFFLIVDRTGRPRAGLARRLVANAPHR